ncbi:hypothetical protein A5695_25585 [Mycobacterium sp. E1747]|nr:hypothetical protein A5695_25585 [Mycobacterium sp. E1747]
MTAAPGTWLQMFAVNHADVIASARQGTSEPSRGRGSVKASKSALAAYLLRVRRRCFVAVTELVTGREHLVLAQAQHDAVDAGHAFTCFSAQQLQLSCSIAIASAHHCPAAMPVLHTAGSP